MTIMSMMAAKPSVIPPTPGTILIGSKTGLENPWTGYGFFDVAQVNVGGSIRITFTAFTYGTGNIAHPGSYPGPLRTRIEQWRGGNYLADWGCDDYGNNPQPAYNQSFDVNVSVNPGDIFKWAYGRYGDNPSFARGGISDVNFYTNEGISSVITIL